jgi:hypothetical protein
LPSIDAVIQGGALVIVAGVVWQFFRVLNGSLERLRRAVELNTRATVRMLLRMGDQLEGDGDLRRLAKEG